MFHKQHFDFNLPCSSLGHSHLKEWAGKHPAPSPALLNAVICNDLSCRLESSVEILKIALHKIDLVVDIVWDKAELVSRD